jgi:hypothetical protein
VKTKMPDMVSELGRSAIHRPSLSLATTPYIDEEKYLDFFHWVSIFH